MKEEEESVKEGEVAMEPVAEQGRVNGSVAKALALMMITVDVSEEPAKVEILVETS